MSRTSRNTRIVRIAAFTLGVGFLAGAALARSLGAPGELVLYLAIGGVLILGSVLAIKGKPQVEQPAERGYWEMTGERFRDPASGAMMEVRRNPVTGERDYVEVESS